ncbi:MAG TPA: heme-copper oxidase subunit III [Planctomycetota bacterium]|nr:heme-copper oxidase subunit III [Planctomycetota bacterium]
MNYVAPAYDPAIDAPAPHHPVYDYDSGPPVHRGKFAIWLFLATEVMFFTGLIGTYIVIRMGTRSWPNPEDRLAVGITAVNTFFLICSSFTMVKAVEASMRWSKQALLGWLGLTVVIGSIFVGIQAYEYVELIKHGSLPNVDLFWSTFYAMTGFHGLHVSAGVLWLIVVWLGVAFGILRREHRMRIELAGLYWHFVDLVWVLLFTIVYLM